jgi:hypothetical protein
MSSIRGEVCWSNLQPNFHGARRHHGTSPLALVFLERVHGLGNFFLSGGVAILLDPMQLDFHTLVASWQLCELYSHSMPLPFNTRPRHVFCFVVLQPWKPGMQIDSLWYARRLLLPHGLTTSPCLPSDRRLRVSDKGERKYSLFQIFDI